MRITAFVLFVVFASLGFAVAADIRGIATTIDADTIDIGARVRLFGIDAPEIGQTCERADGQAWRCGVAARDRLAGLVDGHDVRCKWDQEDDYGRLLGWCFLEDKEINSLLVSEGLAWAFVRYSSDYVGLEAEARATKVGVWQGEAQPPWEYRAARWAVAEQVSPEGCPIKGNINSEGVRIYHAPWSPWYDRTKIDITKGERWFCDEAEAIDAGWRAPLWTR